VSTIPPPEPCQPSPNCWAWSALCAGWRSPNPPPRSKVLGRIRDAYRDYDHHGGASWKD
jgi:hypothetical protein